jgi:hypothetical protein
MSAADLLDTVENLIAYCRCYGPMSTTTSCWTFWNIKDALRRAAATWKQETEPPEAELSSCQGLWGAVYRYVLLLKVVKDVLRRSAAGAKRTALEQHLREAIALCYEIKRLVQQRADWCIENERWGLTLPPAPPLGAGIDVTAAVILDLLEMTCTV